jgi:hypothetical protein
MSSVQWRTASTVLHTRDLDRLLWLGGSLDGARFPRFSRRFLRLGQAAAEPVQERDWGGGGVAGCGDGVAAGGGGGGVHEAVVVGGSVQVGDVLLGDEEGGLW